jgi:hypothetical protein
MRKTRHSKGRNAEFYAIDILPTTEKPAESQMSLLQKNVKTSGRFFTMTSWSYYNKWIHRM